MRAVRDFSFFICALTLLLFSAVLQPASALPVKNEAAATIQTAPHAVWSAIIPEAFPGVVFTWTLHSNGTYSEDGRDIHTGMPMQRTLTGRWSLQNGRMILRQDTLGYVFEGAQINAHYSGVLYQYGEPVARFCSFAGSTPPDACAPEYSS